MRNFILSSFNLWNVPKHSRSPAIVSYGILAPAGTAPAGMLSELKALDDIIWFLEPVRPTEMGCEDYPDIIETPCDLSLVQQR